MTDSPEFPRFSILAKALLPLLRNALATAWLSIILLLPGIIDAEEAAAAPEVRETETVVESNDTIVSEKDEVNLVKDSSVAEAVKRRPDLNFANVTIDGENSGVSLSSLQADDIESVEVMKAVTPDLDADSRGGSISLRTRPTYDQKNRTTSIEGALYYDSIDSATGYRTKLSFSGPLNEARTWGARASISYRDSPYANNTLYQDWDLESVDGKDEFVIRDTGFGHYERDTADLSYSFALDYKASDSFNFFWRNSIDNTDYVTHFNVYKYRLFRGDYTLVNAQGGEVEGADIRNSVWKYSTRADEAESTLGGVYEANNLLVDFRITYKDDETEYLNYFTTDYVLKDVDFRYDLNDPRFPETTVTNGKDLNDASAYVFEDLGDRYYLGDESDIIGAINLKWDGLLNKRNAFIKAGYKSRSRENTRISQVNVYDGFNGSNTLANALSEKTLPDILEGRYRLDTLPDPDAAEAFFVQNKEDFILNERRTHENSDPNNYTVNETVDSLYGMINFEWGNWRTILGVRSESTHIDFIGNEVVLGQDSQGQTVYLETNPVPGESKYDELFPNAHFRYRWNDRITLIGSFTNTIDRPSYTYIVPYRRVNLEEQEIEEGNPALRPSLFTNYDLSVDIELPSQALLSVELFNRSVEDFVFSRKQIVETGIYKGFEAERYENSASADIKGATLTWRQPLDSFLLPDGLSLNANYTKQKSEIEYPARPGEILPLTRTPDQELKVTLSYQGEKFFAQVRYAYEDLIPTRIAGNRNEDTFLLPNDQVDLSFTYQLKKNIRLFADVQNIMNEPYYDRYEGSTTRPAGFRHLPWTMSSGVRVEL